MEQKVCFLQNYLSLMDELSQSVYHMNLLLYINKSLGSLVLVVFCYGFIFWLIVDAK